MNFFNKIKVINSSVTTSNYSNDSNNNNFIKTGQSLLDVFQFKNNIGHKKKMLQILNTPKSNNILLSGINKVNFIDKNQPKEIVIENDELDAIIMNNSNLMENSFNELEIKKFLV